ncbi:MAG: hypothetical protein IJ808_05855 [Muribaculaceae bacterium]|nr:hypothetical protein [Muribaculaceae bacterium]
MKKLYYLATLAVLMLAVTSCEDDDHYYILGHWEKVAVVENGYEYPLDYGEYEEYYFYDDGTGIYWSETGIQTEFFWNTDYNNQLYIRHSDGLTERLYYRMRHGELLLSEDWAFNNYRVFR